jgi:hypothetical protein
MPVELAIYPAEIGRATAGKPTVKRFKRTDNFCVQADHMMIYRLDSLRPTAVDNWARGMEVVLEVDR